MSKEIEVRIKIDPQALETAKKWLTKNAEYLGEKEHIEYYLNKPATSFFFTAPEGYKDAIDYLRVRLTEQGDSICFKKLYEDPIEKRPLYCEEYESEVADGKKVLELFKALGYTDQTLMQKTRQIYTFDCFEIVIDHVKDLGIFMEVELKTEIPNIKAGINLIYDFIRSIGIKRFELQTRGYVSMLWNPTYNFGQIMEL